MSEPGVQEILFKLGVALHAKYPDDALRLLQGPLSEVATFINEQDLGVELNKGTPLGEVNEIADLILSKLDDNS